MFRKVQTSFLLTFATLSVCFYACKKEKLKAVVPAYIHIDKFSLTTDYVTQGSSSSKITDAWVYVDGQLYGTYELPATFPVNLSGSHVFDIRAGIKVNGIAASRAAYPFYNKFIDTLDLEANKDYYLHPTTTYYSTIKFPWKEDFEQAGNSFAYLSNSTNTFATVQQPEAFEGGFSAYGHIDENNKLIEAHSPAITDFTAGNPIYLELNYKCTTPFQIGFYHDNLTPQDQVPLITLNEKSDWNKIYINLTDSLGAHPYSTIYIYFGAALDASHTDGKIYLDNIKFVHG